MALSRKAVSVGRRLELVGGSPVRTPPPTSASRILRLRASVGLGAVAPVKPPARPDPSAAGEMTRPSLRNGCPGHGVAWTLRGPTDATWRRSWRCSVAAWLSQHAWSARALWDETVAAGRARRDAGGVESGGRIGRKSADLREFVTEVAGAARRRRLECEAAARIRGRRAVHRAVTSEPTLEAV